MPNTVANTQTRLQYLMDTNGLKQVDILKKCEPYCIKFDVKMNKSDISQYVSGKVEPSQEKLIILGMALNVSEAWLMGFDVPMSKTDISNDFTEISLKKDENEKKTLSTKEYDRPKLVAAYGGNSVDSEERDKEFTEVKKELISTLYAANLDIRQMKELITIINAFERL